MAEFSYVAISSTGAEQKGTILADTVEAVSAELKQRGLVPVKVSAQSALSKDISISFLEKKPKSRDLSVFCRQFVSILDAGVPVISALEMLSEQTENKVLAKAIRETRLSVEMGESLTTAMNQHVKLFGTMFISMVSAGEASGSLSNSFTRMADQYDKESRIRSLIKKATTYPIVILIVTIAVVIVMLSMVVPTFQDIFNQLDSELPGLTKAVVAASDFMSQNWYFVIGGIIVVVLILRNFAKTKTGKYFFGKVTLRLPVIKNFVTKTASAKMSRTLSTLLSAGIPLIDALEITSRTMTNVYFRDAIDNARTDVSMGSPLSETLRNSKIFPPLVYQMLTIGEETGNIDGMLTKIADYYEEESEAATQQVTAMLEPAIIIVMALLVGTIIMAVMLPLASMYGQLENL